MADTAITIEELQKRIAALEAGQQYQADRAAIQHIEQDHLVQLRTIRASMGKSSSSSSSREMDTLREENEALKKKVAKLQYRVEHLVDGMEHMMQQRAVVAAKPESN